MNFVICEFDVLNTTRAARSSSYKKHGKLWIEFLSFLLWPKGEACGPWKQERTKTDPELAVRTEQTRLIRCSQNCYNYICLCWLFRKKNEIIWRFDRWSRDRGPYGYLQTWNWPITALKISQPYNNASSVQPERVVQVYFLYSLKNQKG